MVTALKKRGFGPVRALAILGMATAMGLGGVTLGAAPAVAQRAEIRPLVDRLDRIERDLNLLQRQVYRGKVTPGGTPPPTTIGVDRKIAARMEVRVNEFESQLREVNGRVEELSFNLRKLQSRVEKLVSDMDLRLSEIEKALAGPRGGTAATAATGPIARGGETLSAPGAASATAQTGQPNGAKVSSETGMVEGVLVPPGQVAAVSSILPKGTVKEQYGYALSLLRQADYVRAEKTLKAFIAAHPDDALVENAKYWLGETYYVRSDFTNAAVVFAEGLQKFPDGPKAPDNLLKLGMALSNLGEKEQACKAFAELNRKFPDASASVHERASREKTRLGCE